MNPYDREPLSFAQCQLDDFFYPENSSLFDLQDYLNDDSNLMNHSNPTIYSNDKVPSESEISDSLQLPSTQAESNKIIIEGPTMETIMSSENDTICHYKNSRRKLEQREPLRKLCKIGQKLAGSESSEDSEERLTAKLTKNLLAFGKKPLLDFIRSKMGSRFLKNNLWFLTMSKKFGMTMQDYDRIYKCEELRPVLKEFFARKTMQRELMISRTTGENKIFHLYYLDVFERNFMKGSFKSISLTMMEIEEERKNILSIRSA